jgi:uncharacterized protein YebE (UPF0316 family)
MTPIVAGLFVFAMRVIDMSLDTLRLLFVMRGWKYQAGALGAVQATVFILAVRRASPSQNSPVRVAMAP